MTNVQPCKIESCLLNPSLLHVYYLLILFSDVLDLCKSVFTDTKYLTQSVTTIRLVRTIVIVKSFLNKYFQ